MGSMELEVMRSHSRSSIGEVKKTLWLLQCEVYFPPLPRADLRCQALEEYFIDVKAVAALKKGGVQPQMSRGTIRAGDFRMLEVDSDSQSEDSSESGSSHGSDHGGDRGGPNR